MFKVLLVDDKEIFLRIIKRIPFFRENPEKVRIIGALRSAAEALDFLRREPVDIVMTDIQMPMMSGIDLLRIIREEDLCPCTILMSEYTEFSYAREGILYGAFDYIVKPLSDEMVAQTLTRAFAHLEKTRILSQEDPVSSPRLISLLLCGEDQAFEKGLEDIRREILTDGDPASAATRIRQISCNLLQTLTADYSSLGSYLPVEALLSVPDSPEYTDPDRAAAYFMRSLRFLYKKLPLFHVPSENRQVQNVWHYTIGSCDAPCRLADTADRFFLNPSYLSSLFKKETGISYKTFVQNLKMERARYLLSISGKKVAEVAEQLHYTDTEYFRKIFKAAAGIPPTKFDYEEYIDKT